MNNIKCICRHKKLTHGPNISTGFDSCRAILPGKKHTVIANQLGLRNDWCSCKRFIESKTISKGGKK